MICNNCKATVSDESKFCNICGKPISIDSKVKNHKKRFIITSIVILCALISYTIYWNISFTTAKKLYEENECFEAMDKIDHLLYFGGNSTFDKIILVGHTFNNYQHIVETMNAKWFSVDRDAEILVWYLINGYWNLEKYENFPKTEELKNVYADVCEAYLMKSVQLGVRWSDIADVAKIDDKDKRSSEAKKLSQKVIEHLE